MDWFSKSALAGTYHEDRFRFEPPSQHPPRPKTPRNPYTGILNIPSTGFLTPSVHGSPSKCAVLFTPSSSSPSRPPQDSPFAPVGETDHVHSRPDGSTRKNPNYISRYPDADRPAHQPLPWEPVGSFFTGLQGTASQNAVNGSKSHSVLQSPNPDSGLRHNIRVRSPYNCPPMGSRILIGSESCDLQRNPDNPFAFGMPTQPQGLETSCITLFGTPSGPRRPQDLSHFTPMPVVRSHPSEHSSILSPPDSRPKGPPKQGFHPMQAITHDGPQRQPDYLTPPHVASTPSHRFSIRYHGMHTDSNASADHLPPEMNCGLWLTNLPPDVDVHQLLASVRNVGRVWCTYINAADHIRHHTAAAKLVFFTPEAARRLLNVSFTTGMVVRGHKVRVDYNRIKSEEHHILGDASRVLIVTGDSKFVNETSLTEYFRARFVFETDEVKELIRAGNRTVIEYRFGSYRCQAQMGKMALEKDRPLGFEKVEFGADPCEVGDTLSAYGVAADRIQGRGI